MEVHVTKYTGKVSSVESGNDEAKNGLEMMKTQRERGRGKRGEKEEKKKKKKKKHNKTRTR